MAATERPPRAAEAAAQAGIAQVQRGAKLQPAGSAARFGGAPGIVVSRVPGSAPCKFAASRPWV